MIEIYVDGSCSNNPGSGGYGVVIFKPWSDEIQYLYHEKEDNTTNNRQELKAIIHAFEWIINNCSNEDDCVIYSDSAYCVNIINDWMFKWHNNNWKKSNDQDIENLDLIITLYNYYTKEISNCQVMKIKGHDDFLGNEIADALAQFNNKKLLKFLSSGGNNNQIVKKFLTNL